MTIKKLYIRELPQKQYHASPSIPIIIPSKCVVEKGDQYVNTHHTYLVDRVIAHSIIACSVYCTVTKNDTICKNPHYIKRRR